MSEDKNMTISIGALVLITIGVIFLLGNLDIVNNAFGKLWPAILLVIGGGIIVNSHMRRK